MIGLALLTACLLGAEPVPTGDAQLEVDVGHLSLEVFTYKPDDYRDGPLIVVMHGVLRNAEEYRDHARGMGDRLHALIAAPKFDLERFPVAAYQQGNILREGRAVPPDEWTGRLLVPLINELRRREGRPEMPCYLIGHSGGGQFLGRLAAFVDTPATRIVIANSGTYLRPNRDEAYPYGFGRLPEELSDERALRRYLAQPLTLYLGTADIIADEHLDQRPEAVAQGPDRLSRGRRTFEAARKLAHDRGWAFHWRLVEAARIEHNHQKMFEHPRCAEALFGLTPASIVAHRGLLQEAPENTLANFRACLALRVGFEFDVQRTRDGALVCLHDDTVDRTTNGHGRVADLTLADLRQLDAGRWFGPQFTGERVPTVDEICSLLAEHREAAVLVAVDIKASDSQVEQDLVRLASQHGILDRLVFIGRTIDDPTVRRRLKAAHPKARVARLAATPAEIPRALADEEADWVYLRLNPGRDELLRIQLSGRRAFLAGPLVAGEEQDNWRAAAEAGFDAILTDHPLALRRVLAGKGTQDR